MMFDKFAFHLVRLLLLIMICVALLIVLIAFIPKPPVTEFNNYKTIISDATRMGADLNVPDVFAYAEYFKNAAFDEWQKQNQKWIVNRDYSETKRMILMAQSIVEEAKNRSEREYNTVQNSDQFQQSIINKNISDLLDYSRKNKRLALIIDKHNHKCHIIENGFKIVSLDIEIGDSNVKRKIIKGDRATSEGWYYITSKKDNADTPYYKALQLNYPNKDDYLFIEDQLTQQKINDSTVLQEKIFIHGNGGKGYDWTDGSVALSDRNIDLLYKVVRIGTKVLIISKVNNQL